MSQTGLDPQGSARARGQAYALVAKLLLEGLDTDTLALVRALPGWLGESPGQGLGLNEDQSEDLLERWIAEHHATFQLGVFPYAGVFLDRSAMAGARSDLAHDFYERAGFRPRLDDVAGDHLGVMAAFLAYAGPQARFDSIVAEFLDACVLSWLPALVVATASLDGQFWRGPAGPLKFWPRVVHAMLELSLEHRLALSPGPTSAGPPPSTCAGLLADEQTGLREIAEHLLAPAASGLFLSRGDLARLGRQHQLPRGFGSRSIMLDTLLRSAVEHGQLSGLLSSLDALVAERDDAMLELARAGLGQTIEPWRAAIAGTRALIATLAAHVPPQSREDAVEQ